MSMNINMSITITSEVVERSWPSYGVSRAPHVCDSEC